jgi:hypothetical protein
LPNLTSSFRERGLLETNRRLSRMDFRLGIG